MIMSKRLLATLGLLFAFYYSFSQAIGIVTTTPDPSAILHVTHSGKGVLIPGMSGGAIEAIPNPAIGLMAYDSFHHRLLVNNCFNASKHSRKPFPIKAPINISHETVR